MKRRYNRFIIFTVFLLLIFQLSVVQSSGLEFWHKGSNAAWGFTDYSGTNTSTKEWATINAAAVFDRVNYSGNEMVRVFPRVDTVNDYYSATRGIYRIEVSEVHAGFKDINGANNTTDRLSINEAYPSKYSNVSGAIIPSGVTMILGYIYQGILIDLLELASNNFYAQGIEHWSPLTEGWTFRSVYAYTNITGGLDPNLKVLNMPNNDLYGTAIPHSDSNRYADWFPRNGFVANFLYTINSSIGTSPYKVRATGKVHYKVFVESGSNSMLIINVQSNIANVDHYVNHIPQ
ncbi:MAG TPA: hypothetical protein VEF53_13925 [Patescibacteria group bacterium]|nr:hypothetical protein [Patescibacteria group bacterium]